MSDALGLEDVVPYDRRWPALFVAERKRIHEASGGRLIRIEHIGGTSIPGMCAKPVLDMAVARPADTTVSDCIAALERAGYEHRGFRGVPGREFFCRGRPRAYHVHLVEDGGRLWRDYLAFRDYLSAHAEEARRFATSKHTLAERFSRDREGYVDAKAGYVQEILELASRPA